MNHKFYRSRPMKGLVWILTCGFLCVSLVCGLFLSYMLSKDQSPVQMADTYTKSSMFADDLDIAVHVCAQDGAACVATQRLTDDKQVAAVLRAGNERR